MHTYTTHQWIIAGFTALYVLAFSGHFLRNLNIEFLLYVGVLLFFYALIFFTIHKTKLPDYLLWPLSVWGLLHLAGGAVMVGDTVLYGWRIVPIFDGGADFFILKMDQVIHAYGFGVSALVVQHLIRTVLAPDRRGFLVGALAALAAMGLSVVNEVIEFLVFISVEHAGVGDVYNLSLDLVFNTIGAVGAIVIYALVHRLKQ